jgi:glycosyltransferase involved in cell wall biosynthesis
MDSITTKVTDKQSGSTHLSCNHGNIPWMNVSVICTVKNEGEAIRGLLDSLTKQSRAPDEVVICDGGSSDNTIEIIEEYQSRLPLKLLIFPGSNISQGRNRAIEAAEGPVIAGTDAGVTLSPIWLAELVRPIEDDGAKTVAGWFVADPQTDFELVMGATVLPDLSDIDPGQFLPSSRSVAYVKEAWSAVGGYPEWLDYGEDIVFDLALREIYGPFPFAPGAKVYFRPRGSLEAFARQYYLYARGDGKANLWPKRHLVRYLTYLVGAPVLSGMVWRGNWLGYLFMLVGGSVYCRRPTQRLLHTIQNKRPRTIILSISLIPIIRLVGDVAKMLGYPMGVIWRLRHRR